jgi:hypothetical protein
VLTSKVAPVAPFLLLLYTRAREGWLLECQMTAIIQQASKPHALGKNFFPKNGGKKCAFSE